jgi:hypothetical protein
MPHQLSWKGIAMMNWKLSTSTALALIFLSSGAQAQVTPEEVWESWQAFSTSAGQELTVGSATRNGDTLEVKGVSVTMKDDLGGSFAANLDTLNFKDRGDGTVEVTMAESYPLTLAFPSGEGPEKLTLTVNQPGITIIAAGTATETSYDFAAPTVTVKVDEIVSDPPAPADLIAEFTMTGNTAKYLVKRDGDKTALDSSFAAKSLAVTISGVDETGTAVKATASLADLSGTSKGNFLGADLMANMAAALNAGFTTDASFNFGAMAMDVDVTEATGPTKIKGSAAGGGFVLAIDKAKVNYGSSMTGASFAVSGPEIPFPEVTLSYAEAAFNVLIPASKSDVPQDFAFLTKLVDFTVSDDVWGMVDPGGTLSREPATIILDAKGTGFWKQDIMDPSAQMEGTAPPGELTSLDLTQVLVKAAGAEVSALGALTFDNTDLVTFGGLPAPTGKIDVNIKGVNTLIDNLIAMGLLPEDQAMGARMMLGMFATPGAGPDELTSVLEFKDKGFFANGQQLQ